MKHTANTQTDPATPKPGRGGARPKAGRHPLDPGKTVKTFSVSMTEEQKRRLEILAGDQGASAWLRQIVDHHWSLR